MKILKSLVQTCKKALPRHPELACYPHWTFIINPKTFQVLSVGVNRTHEPSRKYGYHDHRDVKFKPKLHAELDAIRKCRLPKDFIAVNVRLNKTGQVRLAQPCRACKNLLWVLGCRKVYFSTPEGWDCLERV